MEYTQYFEWVFYGTVMAEILGCADPLESINDLEFWEREYPKQDFK